MSWRGRYRVNCGLAGAVLTGAETRSDVPSGQAHYADVLYCFVT